MERGENDDVMVVEFASHYFNKSKKLNLINWIGTFA